MAGMRASTGLRSAGARLAFQTLDYHCGKM